MRELPSIRALRFHKSCSVLQKHSVPSCEFTNKFISIYLSLFDLAPPHGEDSQASKSFSLVELIISLLA